MRPTIRSVSHRRFALPILLGALASGPASGSADSKPVSVDGAGDIRVGGAGTYLVRIIPRAGFVPTEQLRVTLPVAQGERVRLTFTVYREGRRDDDVGVIVDRGS